MNLTPEKVFQIIGQQQAEIVLLREQVVALQAHVRDDMQAKRAAASAPRVEAAVMNGQE